MGGEQSSSITYKPPDQVIEAAWKSLPTDEAIEEAWKRLHAYHGYDATQYLPAEWMRLKFDPTDYDEAYRLMLSSVDLEQCLAFHKWKSPVLYYQPYDIRWTSPEWVKLLQNLPRDEVALWIEKHNKELDKKWNLLRKSMIVNAAAEYAAIDNLIDSIYYHLQKMIPLYVKQCEFQRGTVTYDIVLIMILDIECVLLYSLLDLKNILETNDCISILTFQTPQPIRKFTVGPTPSPLNGIASINISASQAIMQNRLKM